MSLLYSAFLKQNVQEETKSDRLNIQMFSHIKVYPTVLQPSLMAFLMTPRLVWTVEVPLKQD